MCALSICYDPSQYFEFAPAIHIEPIKLPIQSWDIRIDEQFFCFNTCGFSFCCLDKLGAYADAPRFWCNEQRIDPKPGFFASGFWIL